MSELDTISAPERDRLETYATWLFYERQRVMAELYPGTDRGNAFVRADNPDSAGTATLPPLQRGPRPCFGWWA